MYKELAEFILWPRDFMQNTTDLEAKLYLQHSSAQAFRSLFCINVVSCDMDP